MKNKNKKSLHDFHFQNWETVLTLNYLLASYNKICRFLIFIFFSNVSAFPGCIDNRPRFIFTPKQERAEREICAAIARADCFPSGRQERSARKSRLNTFLSLSFLLRVLCRPKAVVEILGNPLRRRNIYARPFIYTQHCLTPSQTAGRPFFTGF